MSQQDLLEDLNQIEDRINKLKKVFFGADYEVAEDSDDQFTQSKIEVNRNNLLSEQQ